MTRCVILTNPHQKDKDFCAHLQSPICGVDYLKLFWWLYSYQSHYNMLCPTTFWAFLVLCLSFCLWFQDFSSFTWAVFGLVSTFWWQLRWHLLKIFFYRATFRFFSHVLFLFYILSPYICLRTHISTAYFLYCLFLHLSSFNFICDSTVNTDLIAILWRCP